MTASNLYNRIIYNAVSGGTGDFVVASAVTGYRTPTAAGVPDEAVVSYTAETSDKSQWETGQGSWDADTGKVRRTVVRENSLGTTALINFTSAPIVRLDVHAQDVRIKLNSDTTFYISNSGSFNNSGMTPSNAWPCQMSEVQSRLCRNYDFGGFSCIISFENGIYTHDTFSLSWGQDHFLGAFEVILQSSSGNPDDVTLTWDQLVSYSVDKVLVFQNITQQGNVIVEGGTVYCIDMNWTSVGAGRCGFHANFGNCVIFGTHRVMGPCNFTMGAIGSIMQFQPDQVIADGGVVTASTAFAVCEDQGMFYAYSTGFITENGGSWVGKRFELKRGSLASLGNGGYQYFPGTIDGTIDNNSTYVANF